MCELGRHQGALALASSTVREAGLGIPDDSCLGENCLQVSVSLVGHEGVIKVQNFEVRPLAETFDGLVSDVSAIQAQLIELFQRDKVAQTSISNLPVIQRQHSEIGQATQVNQSLVRDSRADKVERLQIF
jgi:hypothetical protein